MSNREYQAILLSYKEDVEEQQEKIVDEADGNMDAWFCKDFTTTMEEALAKFREEYVTILCRNAKVLTPQEVYDAVTEVYKAQLKAFNTLEELWKIPGEALSRSEEIGE